MASSGTAILRPPLTRDESGTLLGQTMTLVAATAGTFALGSYVGRDLAGGWGLLFFLGALVCMVGLNVAAEKSATGAIALLLVFGLLIGLAVAPTLADYASMDPQAVWQVGGATA